MNNTILFLLPDGSLNDATEYYVDILQEAFTKADYTVYRSAKLLDAKKFTKVLTIEAKWFFYVKIVNPSASVMNWFQGVVAEEAFMTKESIWRKKLWQFFEAFTLKFSVLNIYVSNHMKKYFEENYQVKSKIYFVMPCFNKSLNISKIEKSKYIDPTFVYAGSLSKWQCIDKTLEIYSKIEKILPNSKLTLLTKETELAAKLIEKYDVERFEIKYVTLNKLDDELINHKYGFLLRENHIVNNVATPTKMNSYLALGVIPIYSDSIYDFNSLSNTNVVIKHEVNLSDEVLINKIIGYEAIDADIIFSNVEEEITKIFSSYYNEKKYIKQFYKILVDEL